MNGNVLALVAIGSITDALMLRKFGQRRRKSQKNDKYPKKPIFSPGLSGVLSSWEATGGFPTQDKQM
jgi:hypothetical protein